MIGDLGEIVTGKTPSKRDPQNFGGPYPFIKIPDLRNQRYVRTTVDTLSERGADAIKSALLPVGAVLVSCIATIGEVGITTRPSFTNQQINAILSSSGIDPNFLYYACNQLKPLLNAAGGGGSVYTNVSKGRLSKLEIAVPPSPEQRRIAWVLGSIDDKIEVNRQIAKTLEEIAAAIFKARFVDFVGVEEFEDSELGPIPKGWSVFRFSDLVEINPRVPLKKDINAPYVEMAALPPWGTRPTSIGRRPYRGGARFERGDTLMARITGCIEHGKGAFVDFVEEASAGSTEYLVLRATERLTPEAVFFLSRSDRVREHAIANMSGSSGRQRVPPACFNQLAIAWPPHRDIWDADAKTIEAVMRQTNLLWRKNRILEALRDTLLPKLISGEIRVPEGFGPDMVGEVAEELEECVSEGTPAASATA